MKFLELAFELFMVYLLYKLIFNFIIPVYQTTKQMRSKMNEMQEKMKQQQQQQDNFARTQAQPTPKRAVNDDYIDYEEIK